MLPTVYSNLMTSVLYGLKLVPTEEVVLQRLVLHRGQPVFGQPDFVSLKRLFGCTAPAAHLQLAVANCDYHGESPTFFVA